MRFINFSIVKFSIFVSFGIFTSRVYSENSFLLFSVLILFLGLLIFVWLLARKQLFQNIFFGVITYNCFFLVGYINYQLRLPTFQQSHYSNKLYKKTNSKSGTNIVQLKIKETLKPDKFNTKYIVQVVAINSNVVNGDLLMNLRKDSLNLSFVIDDLLLVSTSINKIPIPLNPHQFDYSEYMKRIGICHQIRISKKDIIQKALGTQTLRGWSERIRNYLLLNLERNPLTADEVSIIQALILGQRKDISKQVYSNYAAAGAIHILAVSGLHVGILYFILLFIFTPIKRLFFGTFLSIILIVFCLWGFVFITGMSPSVIRAVTMFTFFAFASIINRQTNSINTLFLSFFVLLLVNPGWLFHVGFQLSYLAVFFILWLLPIFNEWYYPKNYFIRKIWDIVTVTLAAQIGIIPLTLYYFHQFPGLFFLTNIVVLPFLGILLGGGILIIVLAAINILPDKLALAYNFLIKTLNAFIDWIAQQEAFLFQDISFSFEKILASYLLIITLMLLIKRISFYRILFNLVSIVILLCVFILDAYNLSNNQLIVFHKNRTSLIGYKQNRKLLIFRSDSTITYENDFPIKAYCIAHNIGLVTEDILPNIFSYSSKKIVILDSLGVYPKLSKVYAVILIFSPKINLTRMIDLIQPKLIIADGNNYLLYVKRWRKTCEEKKIPFYFTGTEGAYMINSKK